TVAGAISGSINVAGSQSGRPAGQSSVSVSGTGSDLVVAPATIDFGQVRVGSNSIQTVRVSRPASFPAAVNSSNPAFVASAVSSSGESQITFTPTDKGQFSGTITFTVSDPGNPACTLARTVSVKGLGAIVDVSLSVASLSFPDV